MNSDSDRNMILPSRKLTQLDAACVIVGTIIGSGIFASAGTVAGLLPSSTWLIAVWLAGGALSMIGSLCFAELTTAHNQPGGDYYYLTRAFGPQTGLAFAWAAFWIIRPGNIGAMAMVFAEYAVILLGMDDGIANKLVLALAAVALLSLGNMLGVRTGKSTQNILTAIKVLGLAAIFVAAFWASWHGWENAVSADATVPQQPLAVSTLFLSLVLVMFAYGGWNDISFVAAEVRNPRRNLPRALVTGTLTVTLCYVGFNVALLLVLGLNQLAASGEQAPSLMMGAAAPRWGSQMLSWLVCFSCLGAINGMIFTSPRIYYAVGQRYPQMAWLSSWGGRHDGPWAGMLCQALISLLLILICGLRADGFIQILAVTAPYFWIFLALTFVAMIVLRQRGDGDPEAYRVPLYPMPPLLMICVSLAIAYSSVRYVVLMRYDMAALMIGFLMVVGIVMAVAIKPKSKD